MTDIIVSKEELQKMVTNMVADITRKKKGPYDPYKDPTITIDQIIQMTGSYSADRHYKAQEEQGYNIS